MQANPKRVHEIHYFPTGIGITRYWRDDNGSFHSKTTTYRNLSDASRTRLSRVVHRLSKEHIASILPPRPNVDTWSIFTTFSV